MSKNRRRNLEQTELPVEKPPLGNIVPVLNTEQRPETERSAAEPSRALEPDGHAPNSPRAPAALNADQAPPPQKPAHRPKSERIGDVLRQARIARGDDLYLIAEYLRIKPSFLIALESSRYDEFPADAYVIGFLRTYATFLGIDGKEAIDRYRYEMAGRRKKPVLSMPTPVSEGRAPSGIVMAGAALAIFIIYVLWYGISSANRAQVHVPPPLPTTTQPVPDPSAAGLTSPVSTPAPVTVTPPAEPNPAPNQEASTTTPKATSPSSDVKPSVGTSSTALVIPPAAPGIVVTAGKGAPDPVDDIGAKIKEVTKEDKSSKTGKNDKVKDAVARQEEDAKAELKPPVYGESGASRITIRATQNSWVMVIDEAGHTIFDRILKPGESYRVPAKSGLSLTTGNGSGIELSVDGKNYRKAAKGSGMVRNISLDPDHVAD